MTEFVCASSADFQQIQVSQPLYYLSVLFLATVHSELQLYCFHEQQELRAVKCSQNYTKFIRNLKLTESGHNLPIWDRSNSNYYITCKQSAREGVSTIQNSDAYATIISHYKGGGSGGLI